VRIRSRWIIAIAVAGYLSTAIQVIEPDEQGLVRRFGRAQVQLTEPGARIGLPWPFDRVDRVKPREVKRVSIALSKQADQSNDAVQYLTGDRNLIELQATVQYSLADAAAYRFSAHDVESIVASSAESTIGQQLAMSPVDQVLTLGKHELGSKAAEVLQRRLESYGLGIVVRSIDIRSISPPPEVADAFDRVTGALREREQVVHQARGFADRTIAGARGVAQQRLDEAKAHDHRERLAALAEADHFEKVRIEYQQAPLLTAHRLYMQSMAEILPRFRTKVVVGSKASIDIGVVGNERP
jgi:membrane protease subunit HflK